VNATSYNATSDYRVKTDVMALDASFNVDVLKPVTYTNTRHGRQDIGFIAHEVQEHYPFLVNGEKDAEQFQSLNYIGLIGILTKEIQDLKRRLAETEAKADNHNQMINKKMDANMEQVYSMLTSAETKVASIEETVASVENTIHSVENTITSVENTVHSVENTVHSVENTVLLEQARLAICETDVALSKSAIKDLEERFQS
jgi:septal ring factor EnvC (AmiA/AmiB activator)